MAAKEEKKEPDAFEILKNNYAEVKRIMATTQAVHSEAHLAAQRKHLVGKDGLIDPEMLNKADVQKNFLDTMLDHYMKSAIKDLGLTGTPKSVIRQDQILKTYAGVTKGQLKNLLQTHGKDYSLKLHENYRDQMMKKIGEELTSSAQGHIGKEHTGALVKAMGLDDIVDTSKMTHHDALALYSLHDSSGGDKLTQKAIANYYKTELGQASPIYLKEKKDAKTAQMKPYSKAA